MEEIKITKSKEKDTFNLEVGDKISEELGYDEMLGLVSSLAMQSLGTCKPCMGYLHKKEKPYEPKDGDFVASGWEKGNRYCHWIAICREGDNDMEYYSTYAILHTSYSANSGVKEPLEVKYDNCDAQDYTRQATEEEKQLLLSKLAEIGKKWNPEKKCIEDVWTPKDGDFVAFGELKEKQGLQIFKSFEQEGGHSAYITLPVCFGTNDYAEEVDMEDDGFTNKGLRPATEEEKQQLLDALHKEGKDWDAEKKEIVEYRWRPKFEEQYWSMLFSNDFWEFRVLLCRWYDCDYNKKHFDRNIVFKTKEEAEKEAGRRNKLLKEND